MVANFRAYAQRAFGRNAIEILFTFEDKNGTYVGRPVEFASHPEGQIVEQPTLRLKPEEAQELMDSLWHAGLRPTEGTGSAGSLAATERHLADMREIVKKQGLL